jgi:hypothetical protein
VVVRNEVAAIWALAFPWCWLGLCLELKYHMHPHCGKLHASRVFAHHVFLEFDYGEPPIAMGHTVSSSTVPENCLEYSTRNHVIPAWDPTNGTTNENYRKGHSSNYGKPTSPLQTILRMVAETKKATANGAIRLGIDRREREWAWRDDEEGKDQSQYQGVN